MNYYNYAMLPQPQPLQYTESELRKLRESANQHYLNLEEHRAKRLFDEELESRRLERLAEYHAARAMATVDVCEHPDGSFWYTYNIKGVASEYREVFPGVSNFKAKIYNAARGVCSIMKISFILQGEAKTIKFGHEGEDAIKMFLKKLRSSGVIIATSEKYRKDVIGQVLTMLAKTASVETLPLHHGWSVMQDGNFTYVGSTKHTLEEVLEDA